MSRAYRRREEYAQRINAVLDTYPGQWTVRQVFYRLLPWVNHTQSGYSSLAQMLGRLRESGEVDPDRFQDTTRVLHNGNYGATTETPEEWVIEYLGAMPEWYEYELWAEQPVLVEVWVEKDTLVNVAIGAAERYRVPVQSCHGFASIPMIRAAVERLNGVAAHVQVLYVGDFDPSGEYMAHELPKRLRTWGLEDFDFVKIAVTEEQARNLPTAPESPKESDPRTKWFRRAYPDMGCYECEAIPPFELEKNITREIEERIEQAAWATAMERERKARERIRAMLAPLREEGS